METIKRIFEIYFVRSSLQVRPPRHAYLEKILKTDASEGIDKRSSQWDFVRQDGAVDDQGRAHVKNVWSPIATLGTSCLGLLDLRRVLTIPSAEK